ncbi:AMP-binding protein [Pseudoclavibacter sp. AY1F1]|uniref:AMP-binding protein n=1 Tax=Pseudoclavibacter sp. AY1F1 TaxID=2080583 RepID=UPI002157D706|nr:AMP-binding protein [Pseudoclavibacter sp. AY1F1]
MSAASREGEALRPLIRVDARDPAAVTAALVHALSGDGPAVLPTAGAVSVVRDNAKDATANSKDVAAAEDTDDALTSVPNDVVLVIETSGSTAEPKRVMLSAAALRASAAATYARFDELFASEQLAEHTRQWLLTLPASYVAGAQVLMRSILAGTDPVVLGDERFTAEGFARAAEGLTAERRYVSLVPAQLARLLDAAEAEGMVGGPVAQAVARFDAILVGGQSLAPPLRLRAAALGWNLVTSYGSSETSGGSLYNGEPLAGVRVRIRDGEVQLAGPVLATGYLGDTARTAAAFVEEDGERWYRTSDGGRLELDGTTGRERLVVTGRLDNVIVSGGEKVLLDRVEGIVRQLPGLESAVVVAAPSDEWGQVPALVVETLAWGAHPGESGAFLVDAHELSGDDRWSAVRGATSEAGRAARPAKLLLVDHLPYLPSGKPDRRSLERLIERLSGRLS